MSTSSFIPVQGDFDSFNEFTAYAINLEFQDLRIVGNFATTEFVRPSKAMTWAVMEFQAVKSPWAVD